MKKISLSLLALALVFGAITLWALESGGVAAIQTRTHEGEIRSTHIWYVVHNGEMWLEAGTPENPWFVDAQASPLVVLSVDGREVGYRVEAITDPEGHDRIRSLLRDKYGLRDWWVGLLVDTSRSVAVRLIPIEVTP